MALSNPCAWIGRRYVFSREVTVMARSMGSQGKGQTGKARAGGKTARDRVKRPMSAAAHPRTDSGDAFLPDPGDGPARVPDDLAEILAEDFLRSATSGEDAGNDVGEEIVPEELGGPFIESDADEEFAAGPDESNPEDATAEPMPRAVHGLISR